MKKPSVLFLATGWLLLALLSAPADASDTPQSVPTIWRLLDYIAVDYREAVRQGTVVNEVEYAEMEEFSATVVASIKELPPTDASVSLQREAEALQNGIRSKLHPDTIALKARNVASILIQAYPIPLAPAETPSYARGKELYGQVCASCHGSTGAGDGPASMGLDPPPIDFTDRARATERSIFALQQVIEQGLEGTSMISYAALPEEDRWALATYIGAMAFPEELVEAGKRHVAADPQLAGGTLMEGYIGTTPADLALKLGSPELAAEVTAYLRRHPEAAEAQHASSSLALSKSLLGEALIAYRAGNAKQARDLALAAYLDGFEPVEPLLAARDKALMVRIEAAMAGVRSSIAANSSTENVEEQLASLEALFTDAEAVLASNDASSASSFMAAFTILIREGLEALLIVIAVIALIRKAGRTEMLPWIHAGWVVALCAGAATWVLATWVITISGASRELSEGFGSLLAAIVLVWVGIWMHGKSHADAWQRYVQEKFGRAMGRSSGLMLMGLVFVVVYREVFETILFFAAIWSQGNGESVVGGGVAACTILVLIGWFMMRYSRRLPIAQFFRYSSWMIALLAVVLAGKAVSALQEAGYLPIHWMDGWPRLELLGLYPTTEGILTQIAVGAIVLAGYTYSNRQENKRDLAK